MTRGALFNCPRAAAGVIRDEPAAGSADVPLTRHYLVGP